MTRLDLGGGFFAVLPSSGDLEDERTEAVVAAAILEAPRVRGPLFELNAFNLIERCGDPLALRIVVHAATDAELRDAARARHRALLQVNPDLERRQRGALLMREY